jgi:hypothetical protein
MNDDRSKKSVRTEQQPKPRRVHLPGFIGEDEIGLGDVVKRITYAVGITPCNACEKRAAALNRWIVFSR